MSSLQASASGVIFLGQHPHDEHVLVRSVDENGLSQSSLVADATFFVGSDGPRVIDDDSEKNPVQVKPVKADVQNGSHGIGAVAPAPEIGFSNGNPDSRFPVALVNVLQAENADGSLCFLRLDKEVQASRRASGGIG